MKRGSSVIGLVAKGQFLPPVEIKNVQPLQEARLALQEHQARRPDHLALKLRTEKEQREWVEWCDRKQQLMTAVELAERGVSPWVNTQPIRANTPMDVVEDKMKLYREHIALADDADTRESWKKHLRNAQRCKDYVKNHCEKHHLKMPEFEPFPSFKGE